MHNLTFKIKSLFLLLTGVNSRNRQWTGRHGLLQSMGSQRVWYNWVTELNWTESRSSDEVSFNPTTSENFTYFYIFYSLWVWNLPIKYTMHLHCYTTFFLVKLIKHIDISNSGIKFSQIVYFEKKLVFSEVKVSIMRCVEKMPWILEHCNDSSKTTTK